MLSGQILKRSISLLLAVVMLLALPAAALEEAANAQQQSPDTLIEPVQQQQGQQQTVQTVSEGQEMEQEPEVLANAVEAQPVETVPVYVDEQGMYLAPEELVAYRIMTMDQVSDPQEQEPQPTAENVQEKYTGVVAFYDYTRQDEQERFDHPFFFYYQEGVLQSQEPETVAAQGYLDLRTAPVAEADINQAAEQGQRLVYVGREVYVNAEAETHESYLFAFNQQEQPNGLFTGSFEEQEYENGLVKVAQTAEQSEELTQNEVLTQSAEPMRTVAGETVTAGIEAKGISLTWKAVNQATGYRIFRMEEGAENAKLTDVTDLKTLTYLDQGVTSGKTYTYSVRAYTGNASAMAGDVNYGEATKWTEPVAATPITWLSVPETKAAAKADQIVVSWTRSDGAASYELRRSENGQEWTVVYSGTSLTYNDTQVKGGKRYFYQAVAKRGDASSFAADERTDFSKSVALVSALQLSAVNGVGCVELSWKADAGATGYRLGRKTGNSKTVNVIANITNPKTLTYKDTTAQNGVQYTYTVWACYGNTAGMASREISDVTFWSEGRNARITRLGFDNVYSKDKALVLIWSKVSGASGYELRFRTSANGKWGKIIDAGKGTTYSYTSVKNGTTYYLALRTYVKDKAGKKTYSSWSIRKTPEIYHAPLKVTPAMTRDAIKVTWSTDSRATGYRVYRLANKKTEMIANVKRVNGATAYFTDKGSNLTSGTAYSYAVRPYYGGGDLNQVKAANNADWGSYTWNKIVYVKTPVLAAASNYFTGSKVQWKQSDGAVGYYIYRKTGTKGKWQKVGAVNKGSTTAFVDTTVTKLKSGTMLYYTVRAINKDKVLSGYDSAGVSLYYLAKPDNLEASDPTSKGTKIKWKAVSGADNYRVYRKKGANGKWVLLSLVKGTTYLDTKVTNPKVDYYYTVRALAKRDGKTWLGTYEKNGIGFRIRWNGSERSTWVKKDGKMYYVDSQGLLLSGWNYVRRNGETYKYYFDPKTGELSTNLYYTFGRKMREMDTRMEIILCNDDDYASHVNVWLYDSQTKSYCIPAVTFRCAANLELTLYGRSYRSCYIAEGAGLETFLNSSPGCYERYATRVKGSSGYFHSVLYSRPSTYGMMAFTYNQLSNNRNNSNGCIRCQAIFAYLIQDIMKNGYGKTHTVYVDAYSGRKDSGPFGIPYIETISRGQDYEPTDPAYTGKFFYDTQIPLDGGYVKAEAGADIWCYY